MIQNKPHSLHAKVPPAALCVIFLTFVIPVAKVSKEKNVGFLAIFTIGIKIARFARLIEYAKSDKFAKLAQLTPLARLIQPAKIAQFSRLSRLSWFSWFVVFTQLTLVY